MAKKLKTADITKDDLQEYVNTKSGFAFELETLQLLLNKDFDCDHGGTYEDRITKKLRQFDLRAKRQTVRAAIYLAVECKNLHANAPLLITCAPRSRKEVYHDVFGFREDNEFLVELYRNRETEFYPYEHPVGKNISHVRRTQNNSEIIGSDTDIYEKWAQALSSAHDLVDRASRTPRKLREGQPDYFSFVMPIVVVPNEMLWVAEFDECGDQAPTPEPTDRCSYLVGNDYTVDKTELVYRISHSEFVTIKGLESLIDEWFDDRSPVRLMPSHYYKVPGP